MCLFRVCHRGSLVPDEVFQGSFFHQFSTQREIRIRSIGYDLAVCLAEMGPGAFPPVQFEWSKTGTRRRYILCPWSSCAAARLIGSIEAKASWTAASATRKLPTRTLVQQIGILLLLTVAALVVHGYHP